MRPIRPLIKATRHARPHYYHNYSTRTPNSANMSPITLNPLPSLQPHTPSQPPDHWINSPPTSFRNPWPSHDNSRKGPLSLFQVRFGRDRNFVPIPETRDELVKVRTPDWGRGTEGWEDELKATWIGHAGFLVELPIPASNTSSSSSTTTTINSEKGEGVPKRGIRILFDAVFAERFSPVSFAGPKRFTPLPCTIEELPEVDVVCISHNHYDHLDIETIRYIHQTRGDRVHFFAPLGNKEWFVQTSGLGIPETRVTDMDWWEGVEVDVDLDDSRTKGKVRLTCCPAQHGSGRGIRDHGNTLWCSWAVEALSVADIAAAANTTTTTTTSSIDGPAANKKLFFAGDTAYRAFTSPSPCPAFVEIGTKLGPFDLALLPIGCFNPREFMANVHASPQDSLEIHKDIRSKKSIGMHYGVIRGGLSSQYEDVREPVRQWKRACEEEGRWDTGECGVCDVGETVGV